MRIIMLTEAQKRALAEKQKNGERLSSDERAYLRQVENDAKQQGKRLAGIVEADNQKAIAEATPDWQKRPMNVSAERLRLWEQSTGHKDPATLKRMERLRQEAEAEEARIDATMRERAKQAAIEADPAVQQALKHCDGVCERCPELAQDFGELRGLLLGGGAAVIPTYWARAAEVTGKARERTAEAASQAGAALNEAERQYCQAQAALARADGQAEFAAEHT